MITGLNNQISIRVIAGFISSGFSSNGIIHIQIKYAETYLESTFQDTQRCFKRDNANANNYNHV